MTSVPEQQADYVLRVVEERRIRFVQLWFTDVLGRHKAFHVTPAELEDALDEGMTFDGSAIDGFSRVQEADVLAKPDLDTFQLLPWHARGRGRRARRLRHRRPSTASPSRAAPATGSAACSTARVRRGTRSSSRPSSSTSTSTTSSRAGPPRPVDRGSYFDLGTDDVVGGLRRDTVRTLEEMGIPVEHAQHEDAPGPARARPAVHRRADDGRHRDDRAPRREGARAQRRGIAASFMPKPLEGVQGSGMHTHLSLWRDDVNAFVDPEGRYGLSAARPPGSSPACSRTRARSPRSRTSG